MKNRQISWSHDRKHKITYFVRQNGTIMYHPLGTCRMGADHNAVVDISLRVNGVHNLLIVDSSIMPKLISSNTNAPTIMKAEKAADLIRNLA